MDKFEAARILNINLEGLRPDVLRAAYRIMMKIEHPDVGGSLITSQQINRANEILKDYIDEKFIDPIHTLSDNDYINLIRDAELVEHYNKAKTFIDLHLIYKKENPFEGLFGGATPKTKAFDELQKYWISSTCGEGKMYKEFCKYVNDTANSSVMNATECLNKEFQQDMFENCVLHSFMTYSPFVVKDRSRFKGSDEFLQEFLNDLNGDPYEYEPYDRDVTTMDEALETLQSLSGHIDLIEEQIENAKIRIGLFWLNHPNKKHRLFLNEAAKAARISKDLLYEFACLHSKEPIYKNETDRVQQLLKTPFYAKMSVRTAAAALGVSHGLVQRCKKSKAA